MSEVLHRNEKGNTFLEVVILLPLFLGAIFFIIYLAFIINAKKSIVSAVENGVRLAGTRGKSALYSGDVISTPVRPVATGAIKAIDMWHLLDAGLGAREQLLVNTGLEADPAVNLATYSQYVSEIFGAEMDRHTLQDLPPYYSYAIAYTVQAMRMTFGDGIRYPCDPADPENGDNCLLCRPVNPVTFDDTPYVSSGLDRDTILYRRMAIRCDYKPSGFIVKPLLAMLSVLTKDRSGGNAGILSHYSYFDIFEHCYYLQGLRDEIAGVDLPARYCCEDVYLSGSPYCF